MSLRIQADYDRARRLERSDTKDPFSKASKQFFDSLAADEKEIFRATTLAEQVLKEAQLADEASKGRTSRKFADKLRPFVAGIEQYGGAMDVLSNTNSLILCPLWGGIRVILHLAREFGDYFDRITTMLEQIGYNISRLKRYPQLYPDNNVLNQAMAHVYRHIFLFCEKARAAFGEGKRKKEKMFDLAGVRVAMKLIWKPFKEQFEETQQSIAMHVDVIEKEVSIAEKEAAHKERIKAEAERQTQASRWEKMEENNKSLEEHHEKIDHFLDEQSIRKVHEWLSPADVEANHAVASKLRHSHTGEWFLRGQEFRGLIEDGHRFLWLYAIPGAGKTVLSSTIVNYLKENLKSDPDKVGLAYFYCDYKDVQKQCPTRTLGTLLAMLGAQNKDVFHELKTFFEKQRKENLAYTPSFDELRSLLLVASTSRFFSQIYIVIDALDECNDREALMDALLELSNETTGCVKVLVTSRNELDIHSAFSKMSNVFMQKDDVSADMESYITSEVRSRIQSKKIKLRDPSLEQEITAALTEKADGMFQWVKCQIHHLGTMKSDKTIRAALLKLPRTLEDTYVRILQRLEREYEEDIGNVQRILQWLVKGVRTLTLGELAEALSINLDDEDSTAMDFDAVWTDPEDILVLCGSLVTVSPDRTKVALAHYSVKEFLVSSRVLEILPRFYMGGFEVEASLAKTCLTYLCFEDFENGPLPDPTELGHRLEKYHFLKYAAQSWATHSRRYGSGGDKALLDLTLKLLRAESGNFTSWRQIYQSRGNLLQPTTRDFQPLYYASLFGLPGAVKTLITKGVDTNIGNADNGKALQAAALEGHQEVVEILLESCDIQLDCENGNALYSAASRGHDKIALLLLDKGAKIEGHKGKHGTALLVAALEGQKSVVQLLLARKANITVVNKRYGTPLSAAAEKGHERIVRELLQHKVDVNARGGWYGRPLVCAVVGNNENIVQLLINNGADVNARGGKHQTALIAAAALGNLQITRILVKMGAEINDFNDKTGDALHAASLAGHVEIATFLLDSGADVNAKGGKYRNALNAACVEGHQKIVLELLGHGVDVNATDEHFGNALHLAARHGHPEVVRMLVEGGADVNTEGGIYRTTLQAAGSSGLPDMVQLVIDLGVPSGMNDDMSAALMLAAFNGHQDVIRLLVKLGADINGFSITRSYEYWSPLQAAAYDGDAEVVQLLLDLGADVNQEGGVHHTALQAFLEGPSDPEDMPEVLLRAGANVNIGGGEEYGTPLALAAHRGYMKGVRLFLENGADVNQIRVRYRTENKKTTLYFETALQFAVHAEDEEIVELLIEKGADINLAICTDATNSTGYADALQVAAGVGNLSLIHKLVELGAKLDLDSSAPRCRFNSALQAASATGDIDVMRTLIELGSVVDAPGGAVGTALAVAALEGHCDAIKFLLDSGAEVNACNPGRFGTALQAAACGSEIEPISLLVQCGADVNQFAKGSQFGYALIAATAEQDTEIISLLIELGADVNAQNLHPSRYLTALHAAADVGNEEHTAMLIKHGADVNACGGRSGTALTAAYGNAWYVVIGLLLDHGALPDLRGGYYGTAICAGILESSDSLFYRLLHRGGVDPNMECGRWGNPLAAAIRYRESQYLTNKLLDLEEINVNAQGGSYGTALHQACLGGDQELVERLLKRGADINACAGKYWTPLIAAVFSGRLDLVKFLFEKGADIHTINRSGYFGTALQCAVRRSGDLAIVKFLLDHGADVNVKAGRCSTALQAASLGGNEEVVRLLIEKGAEVNAKGGRYGTALAAASLNGDVAVVEILLEEGADVNVEGGCYGNALQSAVINYREELAEMLVSKGAKPQADQKWWKNAPLSLRRESDDLARRLLGIGENDQTKTETESGAEEANGGPTDGPICSAVLLDG